MVVKIFDGAHKVEVLDQECDECGTKFLECEFLSGKGWYYIAFFPLLYISLKNFFVGVSDSISGTSVNQIL